MISIGRLPTPKTYRKRPNYVARFLVAAALIAVVATVAAVALLSVVDPPTSAFIVQRQRELKAVGAKPVIARTWRPAAGISPNLKLAVIAAEDQKFPVHHGFDVEAIGDAVEDRLDGKAERGASTISQQTAKNLFLWSGRSFARKALEAYATGLMELMLPKKRILELYLNFAEFGPSVYGAEAASQAYFGKSASQLDLHEAALLAAVLPNPKARSPRNPSPRVLQRAQWIEQQAARMGRDAVKEL
jgi:monofunctional biosynthetic peptidoglycan transglycosylase